MLITTLGIIIISATGSFDTATRLLIINLLILDLFLSRLEKIQGGERCDQNDKQNENDEYGIL